MNSGSDSPSAFADLRSKAADAVSKVTEVAQEAAGEAKRSAASLAAEAGARGKVMLQERVASGAELVGHVSASAKAAAESLQANAPQLAGLVREAGERMEEFSRDVRDKSIDELLRTASDFSRRQPAVLFGAAAACGFVLFRLFKAASPGGPSQQPPQGAGRDWQPSSNLQPRLPDAPPLPAGQFHGP
jgi:ElaB/YqjD/DUF883 family membrane-anchored ribosome-binding protein